VPGVTLVAGLPEIVGATFDLEVARIEKAGSADTFTPSVTVILMPFHRPVAEGVPLSCPVLLLKLAHEGLFATTKYRALPSGSFAVGLNEYCEPT
jgi:hypothetical protein